MTKPSFSPRKIMPVQRSSHYPSLKLHLGRASTLTFPNSTTLQLRSLTQAQCQEYRPSRMDAFFSLALHLPHPMTSSSSATSTISICFPMTWRNFLSINLPSSPKTNWNQRVWVPVKTFTLRVLRTRLSMDGYSSLLVSKRARRQSGPLFYSFTEVKIGSSIYMYVRS